MQRPIYITGAGGMLGQELSKIFDSSARVFSRLNLDITNYEQAKDIFGVEPKIIINAAAYTDVNGAERDKDIAILINAKGVENLAKIAKDTNSILVHISTDYVFPGNNESGYNEEAAPGNPLNVYGESKLAGEAYLREINPNFYLIRTSWLFGKGGMSFPDKMLQLASERSELKVVNDQHGKPTHVPDLALAIKDIVSRIDTDTELPFGTYHITNEGPATWYEFAQEIFRIRTQEPPVRVVPCDSLEFESLAKRPKWSVLLNTKYPQLRHWKDALKDHLTS